MFIVFVVFKIKKLILLFKRYEQKYELKENRYANSMMKNTTYFIIISFYNIAQRQYINVSKISYLLYHLCDHNIIYIRITEEIISRYSIVNVVNYNSSYIIYTKGH